MNFVTGFLVHLPSVLAGFLLVHQLLPGARPAHLLYKFGLGAGLGLGVTSFFAFLLLIGTNSLSVYIFIPLLLLIVGVFLTWRNWAENPLRPETVEMQKIHKYLLGALGLLILLSFGYYFIQALMNPHGGFDAWMIYNRTARFFYRDVLNWRTSFSQDIYWQFHADYPLMVSLNVAGAWQTLGAENMRAAQAHGTYLLIGLVFLFAGSVALLRTPGQSILAGIILLGTPVYIYEGPREATDLTLAFFILACVSSLFLYHRERNPRLLVVSALASTLAAWTKNEGLPFLLLSLLVSMFFLYRIRRLKHFVYYLYGLTPIVLILYFKYVLAPSNDLFSSQTDMLARIMDTERYVLIFREFVDHLIWFGRGDISLLAVLLVYMLIIGLTPRHVDSDAYLVCSILLATQFMGYFAVYILTPHDLDWHLRTSLSRLIMHLYPSALLLYFTALTDPETVFSE